MIITATNEDGSTIRVSRTTGGKVSFEVNGQTFIATIEDAKQLAKHVDVIAYEAP